VDPIQAAWHFHRYGERRLSVGSRGRRHGSTAYLTGLRGAGDRFGARRLAVGDCATSDECAQRGFGCGGVRVASGR